MHYLFGHSQSTLNRIDELGVSSEKIKLIRRGLCEWSKRENFKLVNHSHLEIISVGRLVEKGYIKIVKSYWIEVLYQLKIIGDGPLKKELKLECTIRTAKKCSFFGRSFSKEIGELYTSPIQLTYWSCGCTRIDLNPQCNS